jgi:ATP-binding cassette subfamily B protein
MLNPSVHKKPLNFFFAINKGVFPLLWGNIILYAIGSLSFVYATSALGKVTDALTSGLGDPKFWSIILVLSLLSYEIFYRLGHICEIFAVTKIRADTKKALFDHTTALSYGYFADRFAGEIAHKISTTTDALEGMTMVVTNEFIENLILVIICAFMLGFVHPWYGYFVIGWALWIIVGSYLLALVLNRRSAKYALEEAKTGGKIVDIYGNISTVKVYGKSEDSDIVHQQILKEKKAYLDLEWINLLVYHFQGISILLLAIGLILVTSSLLGQNLVTIGGIVFMSSAALRLANVTWGMGFSIATFTRSYGESKQNLEDILLPPRIMDGPKQAQSRERVQIKYQAVSFAYNAKKSVLKDFSLTIEPMQKVGIVGLSGAGKTTLANLLLRFFDPQSGAILLNGTDIREFTQEFLRSNISHISQDTSLFHDTIAANIAYGSPSATEEEIKHAAHTAYADEFIDTLPERYQSIVGDRGIKLSGGQRQRIAIARAILANRPVFLLDEATSALDSDSESKIQKALAELIENKTVIAIAHRLSTLSKMDRIVFLEHGQIVEDGTHEELLGRGGKYAELWKMQAGGFLPDL